MNPAEEKFKIEAEARGYEVFKSGYPDFVIVKDGMVLGVEVKKEDGYLMSSQKAMALVFANAGIPFFISRDGGWIDYNKPVRLGKSWDYQKEILMLEEALKIKNNYIDDLFHKLESDIKEMRDLVFLLLKFMEDKI